MKRTIFFIAFASNIIISTCLHAQIKNNDTVQDHYADRPGWRNVYTILIDHRSNLSIAGNPNTGIEEHVAEAKRLLDRQVGPVILGGHSNGGAIITIPGILRTLKVPFTSLALHPVKATHWQIY